MKIIVKREKSSQYSTIGEMLIDGTHTCYTLEDVVREEKIPSETAIPAGCYEVTITYSNRFKKDLPLINNVPNFSGVRIHPGNKAEDTEGCILVGLSKSLDFIGSSKIAFDKIFARIKEAIDKGDKVMIEVIDGQL